MKTLLVALASFVVSVVCQEPLPYNFPTINNDELTMVPWKDYRSFGWLQEACDFTEPCAFGSRQAKWIKLNGSLDSLYPTLSAFYVPDFPAIGFGTNTYDVAYLYSDPLPCLEPANASISYKMWFSGITSVEGCILSISDGLVKCGVKVSNFKTSFHYIHAQQPLPIYDPQQGPYVFFFKFVVPNGFVIVDDISYTGKRCKFTRKNPVDMVNVKMLLYNKEVRDEMSATLSKDVANVRRFMHTWYPENRQHFRRGQPGHLCTVIPCNFDCDWSQYSFGSGLREFDKITDLMQNKRGMWKQTVQSVKFKSNEIAYAILTSPLILPMGNRKRYSLSIKFSKAMLDKNVFICYFNKDIKIISCLKLALEPSKMNADWFSIKSEIPTDSEQFQILIGQTEKSDPQLELSMIRDINVLGC